jgi:hypothetical protein
MRPSFARYSHIAHGICHIADTPLEVRQVYILLATA